ncbi:MAG: toll/interleukin-1 receptor domain-containing protein [bacterium]|nr:toll/interleukin-1 receptor domain-containing protein [Gammaproteobacteria bacterium]
MTRVPQQQEIRRGSGVASLPMTYTCKAFISYSHADERWGRWLHRQLEAFDLPSSTAGHERLPKRPQRPIFRDRDELASSADLNRVLLDALTASENLIVICSGRSAQSRWVNSEIERFIEMGRSDRIFTLLVADTPATAFPPALIKESTIPLAADIRRDGKRNALLKLVAGILALRFDDLKQRHEHKRRQRLLAVTAVSVVGLVLTSSLAIYALLARNHAERAQVAADASRETAQQVTDFLIGILQKANPTNRSPDDISIREVLDNGYAMANDNLTDAPEVRAEVLSTISNAYNTLGLFTRNLSTENSR